MRRSPRRLVTPLLSDLDPSGVTDVMANPDLMSRD
jgi:hypothetical protein